MYSLGYADGRDFGISPLGDAVEPYGPLQETFGALHAMGQTRSLSWPLSVRLSLCPSCLPVHASLFHYIAKSNIWLT